MRAGTRSSLVRQRGRESAHGHNCFDIITLIGLWLEFEDMKPCNIVLDFLSHGSWRIWLIYSVTNRAMASKGSNCTPGP
jgi:hypothetical protein